jgi:RNA polymerase sigma-70 factor (ECF subfamily)
MKTKLTPLSSSSDPRHQLDPARWIAEYRDFLIRYALQRVSDHGLAEDLAQETFLSAWNARHSFRGDCSERTWLTGVLRNKIVDHWRRNARRPLVLAGEFDQDAEDGGVSTPWIESRPDERDTNHPAAAAERAELLSLLDDAVNRLPGSMGRAFRMREIQGRSTEEITSSLNISKANLWVLIHRAKQALRNELQGAWLGHEPQRTEKLAA